MSSRPDRRLNPRRVNEALGLLDGWAKGDRIQGDPQYGDQRNVFYRINTGGDTGGNTGDNNTGDNTGGGSDTGAEWVEPLPWDTDVDSLSSYRHRKDVIRRERQRYDAEIERIKNAPAEELIPF